jgi:hypothetical protein
MASPTDTSQKPARAAERSDDDILTEMRERFTYATDQWADIREEGSEDMRYVSGDPWSAEARKEREDAKRPCLTLDELGQYVNQVINDIRENKRGIKVTPQGAGANDQTAELRQSLIRQIEYRSNAQQQAYTTMFENTVQRSYGFLRIKAQYVNPKSFDQELLIEPLPDPDLVTLDPDGVKPDASDIKYGWIRESRSIKQFKREFPDAQIHDFGPELEKIAPAWIKEDRIYLAEYWTIDYKRRQLLALKPGPASAADPQPQVRTVYADELAQMPSSDQILKDRWVDAPYVCQYLTNGVELLAKEGQPKKTEWRGTTIPIVACYGKVLYVDLGNGTEKKLMSMIRLARDPYMLYCYYRTNQAELVGMTPKTPFIGYEGQFRGHETDWQKASREPIAYLEARPTTEGTGQQVLPLPQRQPYDPPIQSLEMGAESARRAIQAAMGISPLPTSAQRRNEKSGVALKQIEDSAQKGSYHFVDHYEAAITRTGALLDELIPHYYDAARDVTIRQPDDSPKVVRINDPRQPAKDGQPYDATTGEHDVTISVGPAYASEREAASEFADSMAQNPQLMPLIGDLVVKLKGLGPIGDEISERLAAMLPPQLQKQKDGEAPSPQQAQQQMMQMQQQMQQMQQALEQAQRMIETEEAKQQAVIRKAEIDAQKDIEIQKLRNESSFAIAQLQAGGKEQQAHSAAVQTGSKLVHESIENDKDRAHEAAMAAASHLGALEQNQQGADLAQRSQQAQE